MKHFWILFLLLSLSASAMTLGPQHLNQTSLNALYRCLEDGQVIRLYRGHRLLWERHDPDLAVVAVSNEGQVFCAWHSLDIVMIDCNDRRCKLKIEHNGLLDIRDLWISRDRFFWGYTGSVP